MKGLISNQNGPKLEEILRLLAQNDEPTHVALRGFGHASSATVTLKDGRLLNAATATSTGTEALKELLHHDSWHFETFAELRVNRADFTEAVDVGTQIVGLRAEMQAQRAEAEADSRRSHSFSIVGGNATGDALSAAEKQKLDEEYTFLSYYAREIGTSLSLGVSKALAYCEVERALAMRSRGDQWEGVFSGRQTSLSQILSEIS